MIAEPSPPPVAADAVAEDVEAEDAVAAPAPSAARLGRNRDFLAVLGGQGISSFGDAISNTALPLLVLALTGSGFVMGVVGVLSTLPDLLIGLPAGAWADRWDRRRMMLLADLGRAILTALVPLSIALGGPTIAVVIAVAFPLNVLRVLWLAAYTAAVPGLVGRALVPRAAGIFEAVFNIGWVVGPALAGLLTGWIGAGPTIAIDAATFAVSAAALLLVRRPLRADARPEATHLLADVREGIAFVVGHRTLRVVIGLWATTSVLLAGLTNALVFTITIDRGLGAEAVGIVLSAFAVGSLAGSLVAARLAPRPVGPVMLGGAVAYGVTLALAVVTPLAGMVVAGFAAGVTNAFVIIAYLSLRTQLSPDALLGRVGATARTVSVGLQPVGALATGIALDAIGGSATLLVTAAGLVTAGIAFSLVGEVRRARLPG